MLHLLVYPASNGYNSYMDRDTGPIGGIKSPMQPTRELYHVTILFDIVAIVLSMFINVWFTVGVIIYILASKAYSYRGIRLKRYPVAGYITVIVCQGALIFFLVYNAVQHTVNELPYLQMTAASLLIGGFYPLTQVYQHEADKKDGVNTISSLLGYKGTFIFTSIVYLLAFAVLFRTYQLQDKPENFLILAVGLSPVLVYFFYWAIQVWKDRSAADYTHTMRMNVLASLCCNIAFIIILSRRFFE